MVEKGKEKQIDEQASCTGWAWSNKTWLLAESIDRRRRKRRREGEKIEIKVKK